MGRKTLHDDSYQFVRETEKAICVTDGKKEVWLPKSQIEYELKQVTGTTFADVTMPEWLAIDKGLV